MGSIRAKMAAAFAVFILPFGIAHAQLPFWPQYRSWWGHHAPFRHKHQHRHTKSELVNSDQINDAPQGPLQIIISIADQRVSLYDNGALIARSSVSTGTQCHPTPLGVFSVISKQRWHRSNLYSAAPMPYMQRITWSGIALHAGVLPGYPASHGCIRLTNGFATRPWHLTKRPRV
jgi:lipoprotein-anchoring transpeptidase ErfK/SrfK